MTPRQFLSQHGAPVFTRYQAGEDGFAVIPANPDRYLLHFLWGSGSGFIVPESRDLYAGNGIVLQTPGQGFKLTHPHDGTMVNVSWFVFLSSSAHFVYVAEAFIRSATETISPVDAPVGVTVNAAVPVSMNIPATEARPVEIVPMGDHFRRMRETMYRQGIAGLPRGVTMAEVIEISRAVRPEPDPLNPIHYLQEISDPVVAAYAANGNYVWYSVATQWFYIEVV